jgi:hypothetical protein
MYHQHRDLKGFEPRKPDQVPGMRSARLFIADYLVGRTTHSLKAPDARRDILRSSEQVARADFSHDA